MSDRDAVEGFVGKWRARWPEWVAAEPFIAPDHRQRAVAWFALRDELLDAAWSGEDARPGDAKLGWWSEELDGWSRGARRHPLGAALQKVSAPWSNLAACLPALRASRERPHDLDDALFALEPFAEALAGIAQHLFASQAPAPVPARNVAVTLLAERVLRLPDTSTPLGDIDARGWARGLLARWPPPGDGTCPGRLHAAIVRARLLRYIQGRNPLVPRLPALLIAWRAARGRATHLVGAADRRS